MLDDGSYSRLASEKERDLEVTFELPRTMPGYIKESGAATYPSLVTGRMRDGGRWALRLRRDL
jgi:hypothetical protein